MSFVGLWGESKDEARGELGVTRNTYLCVSGPGRNVMRVLIELEEATIEGEIISGDLLYNGAAEFDLESTFVVRCDDGARFTIYG